LNVTQKGDAMTEQTIKQTEAEVPVPADEFSDELSDEVLDRERGTFACWKSITSHSPES
jgi:hypothetical protein